MKKIGIVCDTWKANHFRKGLLKAGFTLSSDGSLNKHTHAFTILTTPAEFDKVKVEVERLLKRMEIEVKHSN